MYKSDVNDARETVDAFMAIVKEGLLCPIAIELLSARLDPSIGFKFLKDPPFVKTLPVLTKMKEFVIAKAPYVNFTSPTGTGKSMALPIIYLSRGIDTAVKYRATTLLIMCQPKTIPLRQTKENVRNVLSRVDPDTSKHVRFHSHTSSILSALNAADFKPSQSGQVHFVACLPSVALDLFFVLYKQGHLHRTRWIIDEVHERTADTDLLLTYLALVRVGGSTGTFLPPAHHAPKPKSEMLVGEEITEAVVTL
eukprot:PhF_6_TR18751/c0_g1_i1/m.27381